ncbi:MAG: hypothetical protein QOH41_201 [Blastocatellia bacterium]|nr:hypothetical protein [Blastocatellia bacterium]
MAVEQPLAVVETERVAPAAAGLTRRWDPSLPIVALVVVAEAVAAAEAVQRFVVEVVKFVRIQPEAQVAVGSPEAMSPRVMQYPECHAALL